MGEALRAGAMVWKGGVRFKSYLRSKMNRIRRAIAYGVVVTGVVND